MVVNIQRIDSHDGSIQRYESHNEVVTGGGYNYIPLGLKDTNPQVKERSAPIDQHGWFVELENLGPGKVGIQAVAQCAKLVP